MFLNGVLLLEKLELPTESTTYCRLCLARDNLVAMTRAAEKLPPTDYDDNESSTKRVNQLIELIFECTNVRLSPEDEPGCAICQCCQRALVEFYRFRSQAKRVDELIKSRLEETIKEISGTNGTDKTEQPQQQNQLPQPEVVIEEEKGEKAVNDDAATPKDSTIISMLAPDRKRTVLLSAVDFVAVGIKRPRLKLKPNPVIIPSSGTAGGGGKFKCRYCPKSFKTAVALTEHARAHSRAHRCPNCLEQFQHAPSLARHIRNRTCFTFTKYRCRVCTESFLEQGHWAEHIKIHAVDFPYQCQECLSQFKHKATLRRHVNTVHLLQY